ncbi:MAG: CPBP family intramembrane metalloprotease [Myxococcota bacterium]|nr:CPBP family intramembrane metalloprotease [Myxococcota bacterium]
MESLHPMGGAALARRPDPRRLVGLGLAFYGALLLLAWLWRGVWSGESLLLADAASRIVWPRDLGLGLGSAAAMIAASRWLTDHTRWGAALARELAALVGPLRPQQAWLLALTSGVAEEAFFRGALQPQVGLWLASLLFALAHFVPRRDLLAWAPFSLVAGLLLGGLYAATGSLVAPIVAHVVLNGVNLSRLARELAPRPAVD